MTIKKLIEVALPLEAINAAAAYEKMPGIGPHPRGLHQWWARRPLAAARAVIWSSLVDDPSSHPELFPSEEEQNTERKRLFKILEELVVWKNSNNKDVLDRAKKEILKYTNGKFPVLLDPFAGGGAIPLEAQRLGLEAHAHDLNPVAVMINKAMIEIPPKFANQPPIHPRKNTLGTEIYTGVDGLAEDVEYYGNLLRKMAFEKVGYLYPNVKISKENGYDIANVVAWLWTRVVKCSNPACGCEIPLIKSFDLSKKKNRECCIFLEFKDKKPIFSVKPGKSTQNGNVKRSGAYCPCCGNNLSFTYLRDEFSKNQIRSVMTAIVAEGKNTKIYLSPDLESLKAAEVEKPKEFPTNILYGKAKANVGLYGLKETSDLFNNRQLTTLVTFCNLLPILIEQINSDIQKRTDKIHFVDTNISEYIGSILLYLSFAIDRLADFSTSVSRWAVTNEKAMNCFSKQAIPMTWDYPEVNIFGDSVGSFSTIINYIVDCIKTLPKTKTNGFVKQIDATIEESFQSIMISTDPPYYDNIAYADLGDFFYVWLRKNLSQLFPEYFKTLQTPKSEELVATPYRFNGDTDMAKKFFEDGMYKACLNFYKYTSENIPTTIYYAFKQSENEVDDLVETTSSNGWEAMLSAIIRAGFSITGTWPIRTEQSERTVGMNANALASSIVLVCRKRPENSPVCSRRNFLMELKKELKSALTKMQNSDLAPVDLAQSAIGPGIGIFSKYSKVLEADGKPMSVRSALQIINNEIDLYFNGQDEDLDKESRFCVELYTQYGFDSLKYGDAETLSKAKNASITLLSDEGILFAEKGIVHLVDRSELKWPKEINARKTGIWLWAQLLTKELAENGINGASKLVSYISSSDSSDKAEKAKALVYRLYTIAEHKNWAKEAYAYNSLVISWSQILASSSNKIVKQQTLQF